MEQSPTVQQLIDNIQTERAAWETLIEQIDQERLTSPGVAGSWSVKDIIAHITWFEREMVSLVKAHALVGSELWNLPTDERNAAIYEEIRGASLDRVLEDSAQVHQQILELLPTLSDKDLTNPESFPDMPPDWQPWLIIAQNTYEHYQQHIPDLEKWIAASGSGQ
jgi:uncharacterized damage-inducible protein DinB